MAELLSLGPSNLGPVAEDATRTYLALVRMPAPTRALLVAQGLPAVRLDLALAQLHEWRLITVLAGGIIEVPPPHVAITQHAQRLERQAEAARASTQNLDRVYDAARAAVVGAIDPGVRVLHDLDAVGQATNEIVAQARHRIRMFRGMTARTRQVIDAPMASHREPSVGLGGRMVDMLTIWDSAVLELPNILPIMAARRQGQETQRFLPLFPISVIIVDDHSAILEWSDASGYAEPQGVLGTSPGAVKAARALFDRFWMLATPVDAEGRAPAELRELDDRDAMILRLMAAGMSDASIARQAGISQRTVERRVRHVMERLGAQTRFQAGVQAMRRHWL